MSEETSIHQHGIVNPGSPSEHIQSALSRALALDSDLPDWVLDVQGMSGRLYRRFVNNLIRATPNARYLEIGSWAGSTACSAMANNAVKVTCVDNWSLFDGPQDLFLENTSRARSKDVDFLFVESDFRELDYTSLGRFNVYLFDGPHEYQDQYDGVRLAQPCLDDEFVLIVDDWNWEPVRKGTWDALADSGCQVVYHTEIRTTQDGTHPVKAIQKDSAWHNGYFIAHVKKGAGALSSNALAQTPVAMPAPTLGQDRLGDVYQQYEALLSGLGQPRSLAEALRFARACGKWRYPTAISDTAFIDGLYKVFLGRPADPTGAKHYGALLRRKGRARVLADLMSAAQPGASS